MFPGGTNGRREAWKLLWPCDTRSRFRQYLSWGTDCFSGSVSPHYDPNRDGMYCRRQSQLWKRYFKRQYYAVVLGSVAFLACISCKPKPQESTPNAAYSAIEKQFISGELSVARKQADEAYRHFESSRPDWAATFRIELAKILIYQGKSDEALTLLQPPLPPHSTIESEVRRK